MRQGESIAAALRQAQPGTTIWVEPGTYNESLEWGTDNICLRAAGGGEVVLQGQNRGMVPGGDDTVIEGFTLRGFTSSVAFWTGNGNTQRRVTLQRMRIVASNAGYAEGINSYGDNRGFGGANAPATVDGLLLLDVHVENAVLGVSCNAGPCRHWWIERSSIAARPGAGGSGADAFAIEEGSQIVLVDTTVSGASADGIDTKATDVVVFGCKVLHVQRNALKQWGGGDIIDTVINGSGADASVVGTRGRFRYLHVVVAHHGEGGNQYVGTWGYGSGQPLQLEIVNSIFYHNASGGMYVPAGSDVSIRNTIFDSPGGKLMDVGGQYMMADLARFEADGHGSGNLIANPRFVAIDDDRFETAQDSPARDAAEPVEGLQRDLEARPRIVGAGPDIGAAEAQ